MAEILYLDGNKALEFTSKAEFLEGKTKLFTEEEAHYESERGYRFPWGNLSEKRVTDEVNWIYLGMRWGKALREICYRSEMSDAAIMDATLMYLPAQGTSMDVWTDDNDLDEYGAIIIEIDGEDNLSEKELREDVWETYIKNMELVAQEVLHIAGEFKYDDTYLVKKMIDPDE